MLTFNKLSDKFRAVFLKKKKKRPSIDLNEADLLPDRLTINIDEDLLPERPKIKIDNIHDEPSGHKERTKRDEKKVRKMCAICLESVTEEEKIYMCSECGSAMHYSCMKSLNIRVCPNCKKKIGNI